jgi:hypothetical protein
VQPVLGDGDHRRGDITDLAARHPGRHGQGQPGPAVSATGWDMIDDLVRIVDQLQ